MNQTTCNIQDVMDEPSQVPVNQHLPPRVAEKRLLEVASQLPGLNILAMSTGRAQAAEQLARYRPESNVACWYLDGYQATLAREHVVHHENLSIECLADWPERTCDLALLPLSMGGESELARDLMQMAFHRLETGGYFAVAVDNPKDQWLHDQMKTFDKSVKVRAFDEAMVYIVQKKTPLKKLRDFSCELVYRDLDKLIKLVTRPGVFSHRQIDPGARQLIDAVDVFPNADLLDIGCGSGSVSLALALREPSSRVHAVDSNARAIWCTQRGAELNAIKNLTVELNPTGEYGQANHFDMALANPPYYADFRIAELFVHAAIRSLRPEGRLVLVTKQPKWYEENLHRWLDNTEIYPSKKYHIASGTKPIA